MKVADSMYLGLKAVRERPLESGLIILGICLASAVASSSLLLLGSQQAQTERLLQSPSYREVVVRVSDTNGQAQNAVRTLNSDTNRERITLSDKDLIAIVNENPSIIAGYHFDLQNYRTQANGGGVFFGGGQQSAGQQNAGRQNRQTIQGDFPGFQEEKVPEGVSLLKPSSDTFRGAEVSSSFFTAFKLQIEFGSLFTANDSQNRAAVMVLGKDLARSLFPDKEPKDLVGQKLQLNGRIWTLVGILDDASGTVTLSNGTLLGDLALSPSVELGFTGPNGENIRMFRPNSTLRFMVDETSNLSNVYQTISDYFKANYGDDVVTISIPFEEARVSRDGFNRLLWIMVVFGLGSFAMALINLVNMMLTRALRRKMPLGILSAMGASLSELRKIQIIEGGFMSVGGTLLGVALSVPLFGILFKAGQNLFGISSQSAPLDLVAFALSTPLLLAISLGLALIPAIQMSRISPALALKSE